MKKKLKYLLFLIILFMMGTTTVRAERMTSTNVPNNSYIIGTHMFTDKTSLSTSHIMLAGKTIDSDNLNDMIMYYKTPRGKWINGATGESITAPANFKIDYKDLVSFIPVLKQPTVSINFVKYTKDGMEYNLIINNLDSADGVILSYYDGNNMKELNKIAKREINNGKTTVTIPYGYDNNFKIKTYKEYDNETLYSEYSNGFNIDTRLEKTSISTHELRNGSETETGVEYFLNISGKQLDYVDGIELYYSTSETDEYTLLKRVTSNRIKDDNYKITVPAPHGYSNYYKVRMYKTYSDETVYSDYSQYNIDSTFGKPSISGCEWVDYVGNGVIEYSLDLDNFENNVGVYPTGVELYYATSLDGEYSLLTTTDTIVNKINFTLIGGKHYYLKARSYFDADTKIYSEFSNIYDRIEFYTIKYNLDGGEAYWIEGTNPLADYYFTESDYVLNTGIRKEGSIFLGWTGSNGDIPQKEVTIAKGTTGNLEYTANWRLVGDVNGDGRVSVRDLSIVNGYRISGSFNNIPESEIIEFGDVNKDGDIDEIDIRIFERYITDAEGYGIDKLPYDSGEKYPINYNLNGGEETKNSNLYAQFLLPYTLNNPTKEGYAFIGWTGNNGNTPQTEVTIPQGTTGNLQYTANWGLYGDVNNDGKINNEDLTLLAQYLRGKNVEILEATSDVNSDGEVDDVDEVILRKYLEDAEGYGIQLPYDSKYKWELSYNLNGGRFTEENYNIKAYAKISLPYTLKNPVKEGYVFLGWEVFLGELEKEVTITEPIGDYEYVAVWGLLGDVNGDGVLNAKDLLSARKYWNGENIEINKTNTDVNQDGKVDDVDYILIRKYFAGWNVEFPYNSGETYTISYNLDGGKVENYNIKIYAQISLPYTLINPIKEGYVFIGWTGSNGNTPQKEVTITEGITGNLEYTAYWQLLGDINGDGVLNAKDLRIIRNYISGNYEEIPFTAVVECGDVNLDGEIDDVDLMILSKYISDGGKYNPEGYAIKLPYASGEKYTISYNLDGGVVKNSNIKTYAQISLPYTLNNPTKEGYVFIGWTGSNGNTPQTEVTITEETTGNLEYTANWEKVN